MKIFKPHFWYDKRQRNGVFFLIILIAGLQYIYTYTDFSTKEIKENDYSNTIAIQQAIDSVRKRNIESEKKQTFYLFNPNYISDFKGYQLGMSIEEIDRLHQYRKQNKYVNSEKEFQEVTKVSDSLLSKIAPYFKFPDWVNKKNKKNFKVNKNASTPISKLGNKEIRDINKATEKDFIEALNLDSRIAGRLIKYRNRIQGFTFENQLEEVWGINKVEAEAILSVFKILQKPTIQKINVNEASFKEVLKNPYIDFELCKKIFDYKEEVAEIQDIKELKNISNFPLEKYDRIILYLEAK